MRFFLLLQAILEETTELLRDLKASSFSPFEKEIFSSVIGKINSVLSQLPRELVKGTEVLKSVCKTF